MFVIKYHKIFLALSALFILASVGVIALFGLRLGIDFTGGTIVEVSYVVPDPDASKIYERPELAPLEERLGVLPWEEILVQPTGTDGYIVRTKELTPGERDQLLAALSLDGKNPFVEKRYNLVGPSVGRELQSKAWIAFMVTSIAIILYIAFAFRRVSEMMSSWVYGVVAVLALIHNVLVPTGMFAFLGNLFIEYQVDVLFVTALLAIFGFSVNDTIVIFDRVRENLRKNKEQKLRKPFADVVGASISETLARSINISLAIVLVLASLYLLGGESTREFSLVLGLGVVFGTYSSICFAAPLLVALERVLKRRAE